MEDRNSNIHDNDRTSPESIIERVKYLIGLSRLSQGKFAQRISMDPANLSKVLSGNLKLSDTFLNRVVVELGVSKKWLLSGEGIPFEKAPDRDLETLLADKNSINPYKAKGTPVYDIDVTAGFQELSRELTRENVVGFMDFPKLDPSCVMVRASGDSMVPVIADGAFIAIRPVHLDGLLSWGQIYVVILDDYRLVKYMRKHSDPSKIILHSANPDYDDIEIKRSDIRSLYLVEAVVNLKLM